MDLFFGTQKPTKKTKKSAGLRSYHLISVRKTPKGSVVSYVEDVGLTKQSRSPSGAAKKFITMLHDNSTTSKKIRNDLKCGAKCTYYITIRQVVNTPSGDTSKSLEPVLYTTSKQEIVRDYMGKIIKDPRTVIIDGVPVLFKTRVLIKAL